MRFQTGHAEVHAEGFGETAKFTIAANAKAFKGLIDGLYSRKIEAVMRELATNAFDAHKMVSSIAPFAVHLPTPLQPTFWIRDYGPGMSDDFMRNRYTVMFDSTKDGLNEADAGLITPDEQVGCLGLGRMSFFTITDTCTVTIWQAGEARHYVVFIGKRGEPEVAPAGVMPSDEPDGVKVEFAVKPRDFKSFETAAARVFKGFSVQPTGLPIDMRAEIATEPLEMGAFWKAYPKAYLPGGGFYARQGCVLYPIDLTQIDDRLVVTDDSGLDGEYTVELSEAYARYAKLDMTIVMDFPIGTIDFDLSRERLAYNDRTVEAIRKRWDEFIADLDGVIEKNFNSRAAGFDRYLTARSDVFEGLGPLFQQSMYFIEANKTEQFIHELLPGQRKEFRSDLHAFKKVIEFRDKDDEEGGDILRNNVFVYSQRQMHEGPKAETIRDSIFVFIDGTQRDLNWRLHYHLRQVGKRYAYVFEKGCLSLARWREMGCPPIVRSSELIGPPKEIAEKRARTHSGGGVFDRIKIIDENDNLRAPTEDEDTEDHLFAFINKGVLINPTMRAYPDMTLDDVIHLNALLRATGGPAISIINTRTNDKPGRWDDLPLFYDVLDTFAERLTKKHVGMFVAWLNESRLTASHYGKALRELYGYGKRKAQVFPKNPLTAMRRFYASRAQKDPELSPRFAHLQGSSNPALIKITNDIIDIGGKLGMEILPPSDSITPLPGIWEQRTKLINGLMRVNAYDSQYTDARKAAYALLMQP